MKSISGKKFSKALEHRGWRLLRIKGSHHIYSDPTGQIRVVVPVHGNDDLKLGLLKSLLRDTGLTESEI
jgi:predicted RNA binding protein YcfA (HicA-like mRNA interferase family)